MNLVSGVHKQSGVLDSAMFLCRHNQVQTSFRCHYVVINEVTLVDFVIFHLGRFFLHLARSKYSRIKDAHCHSTIYSSEAKCKQRSLSSSFRYKPRRFPLTAFKANDATLAFLQKLEENWFNFSERICVNWAYF